ncbi:prophage encoded DNA modification methylase [Yersinia mollaretii]|nr:prophage encoded DNA modification methylase [Yersinia mollaretii]
MVSVSMFWLVLYIILSLNLEIGVNIQAVDIFCGAGGLTYGLNKSGINVTHGVDFDEYCRFPIEENNSNTKFVHKSVTELTEDEVDSMFVAGNIRLIAGCAPCQPFSKYSNLKNKKEDDKWKLLSEFERLVISIKPELVTMENVPQLKDQTIFKAFVDNLEVNGYFVWYKVVNCSLYGLPQNRKRLILLASLLGAIEIEEPDIENIVTVRDAIGSLPPIPAGSINQQDPMHRAPALKSINLKRIQASKAGGTWDDWPEYLLADCHKKQSGSTYKSVYGRMSWGDTSPTITTQCYGYGNGRFGHPEQDRAITLREAAIIQSFPKDYQFLNQKVPFSFRKLGTMIGNAVPVRIGEVIGSTFIKHVESKGIHSL